MKKTSRNPFGSLLSVLAHVGLLYWLLYFSIREETPVHTAMISVDVSPIIPKLKPEPLSAIDSHPSGGSSPPAALLPQTVKPKEPGNPNIDPKKSQNPTPPVSNEPSINPNKPPAQTTNTGKYGYPTGDGAGTGTGDGTSPGAGRGSSYSVEDWGGKGRRGIIKYVIPPYPDGANQSLDIKLRITILPNGSISDVFLLKKGNAQMENAAMSSIKHWKFEPLSSSQEQISQVVTIVFPFRVR